MTKKVLILAGILLLLSGISKVMASPGYVVVGYAPGYNSNAGYGFASASKYQTDIPWGSLSHVYFAFATVGGTNAAMDDPNAMAAGLCAYAHANGVRCYISVGGASGNNWPTDTSNSANCSTLAQNIANLLTKTAGVTFDGIDIDWEVPNTGAPAQSGFLAGLISNLRTDLNAKTPGMAKTGKYPGESNVGLSMYLEAGYYICDYSNLSTVINDLDWCTQSGYDININVAGDIYQAALTETSYSFTNCVSTSILADISHIANYFNTYSGTQIPYNKMILGMPLYARNAAGSTTVPAALVGTGTIGTYDTTRREAQVTYGGVSYGADTGQSYCDKINWAIGKGYQGIGMWDLGQGLPTTSNSMVTSIWNVLNGSNSCVTVSSGCGTATCTFTPTNSPTPACGKLVDNFESGLTQNALLGQWSDYIPTGCSATMTNTINDGLLSSIYGMRLSGATTAANASTYNTGLALAPGTYNASAAGESGLTFWVRVDQWSGTGQPATILVEIQTAGSSGAEYATTVTVPAANVGNGTFKSGTPYLCTVYFSNFVYQTWSAGGTGATTMSLTNLYLLTFAAEPSAANFNYDMTLDNIYFGCPPTPTPTFTPSPTPTYTFTLTATKTLTNTSTNTPASTPTSTATKTNTMTPTFTPTNSPANTSTSTPTYTPTNSVTSTATKTSTNTPGNTSTSTPTFTATNSVTSTVTKTATNTPTNTNSPTNTLTPTNSFTPTITLTPTNTNTGTLGPTGTFTMTATSTRTSTFTPSATNTITDTATLTPSNTGTNTMTPTRTNSPTITNTPNGPTNTFTNTSTTTYTFTVTQTLTNTYTATGTNSPTSTRTNTPSVPTSTFTNTATNTFSFTPTWTPTFTYTFTPTYTATPTNTATSSFTATFTDTPTDTWTPTKVPTKTFTPTPTWTPTVTYTPTMTNTATPTAINRILYTPPFPNPVSTGPVEIDVTTPGASVIHMDVFTLAFRKVVEHTFNAGAANGQYGTVTAVQWDLRDTMGMKVADGLYYVRIRVMGSEGSDRIIKVLVLR